MACLGFVTYDPATAVSYGGSSFAAFDTTNLRLVFTVPASGRVFVRLQCQVHGNASLYSTFLLGVLQGSTVIARVCPVGGLKGTSAASGVVTQDARFVVGGLTPSAELTWDAALQYKTAATSSLMKAGGPDNATVNDAFGAVTFEVWDA